MTLAIIAIVGGFIISMVAPEASPTPDYIKRMPGDVIRVFPTSSRIYPTVEYTETEGEYLLTDFYEWDGRKWERKNIIPLPLNKNRVIETRG